MLDIYASGDFMEVNHLKEGDCIQLNAEGTTIVMVTHDARVAARCSRVLYIVDGDIKGEYIGPEAGRLQEKERERKLNNWLMDLGW